MEEIGALSSIVDEASSLWITKNGSCVKEQHLELEESPSLAEKFISYSPLEKSPLPRYLS